MKEMTVSAFQAMRAMQIARDAAFIAVSRPEPHPYDPLDGIDTPLQDWDREFEQRVGWLPEFSPLRLNTRVIVEALANGYDFTPEHLRADFHVVQRNSRHAPCPSTSAKGNHS